MSFSEDLSIIRDDDFEGSSDEIRISQEVFYGNGSTGGERGKISGFVNFGCQQHKSVESSPSLNTGAVTNASSSQTLCLKDGTDVHGDSARNSPSASFPEAFMPEERNDPSVPAKRMKLSIDDLSSFKPFLQTALASDAPLKAIISGFDHPKSRFDSQTVMCHVVESSGGGVRSSCYLLKQGGETDQKICSLDVVRSKDYSVGSEGSEGKEIVGSSTMASPVSQESSATKTLVTNSVVTTVDNTGTRPRAVRKRKMGTPFELDNDETPWTGDCTKELRPFLRNRVFHLLADAGWIIEKRKRHCRSYEEFVYVSPLKRPVRELAKAWSVCGQILHADIYKDLEVEDGKQWTSIDHLCSDLYKTTSNMESELKDLEPKHAILRQWVLLNPFVTVVFLDRNLRSLRAGTVAVKHNADDTSDTCEKSVVVGKGKRSAGGSTIKPCNSSLASESTVIEFGTLSQGCKVDDSPSKSVYVSEGSCMRLLESDDKIEGYSGIVSVNDSRYQCSSSLPVCGSDMTSLQPAGDLYDVPVDSGNFGFRKNVTDDCLDSSSKGKRKRSRKVSEIEVAFLSEDEILNLGTPSRVEVDDQKMNSLIYKASDNKSSKKMSSSTNYSKKRPAKKKSLPCQPKDDDLLVSAIVQQKKFRPSSKKYNVKAGNKVRRLKKRKNKSGCRLLPRNLGKGGKQFPEERWTLIAERTVLSWLIHTGAVLLNEFIQYRDFKGETVLKNGMITRDGIICRCCNEVFSVSGFEVHAGLKMINLGWNLFTDSGQLFTTLILEAWSAEYKARKAGLRAVQSDEFDQNDDSCGLCGDGGELLCCDKCPSTFHQSCLSAEELPEGSWYCASCTCWICGDLVDDEDSSSRYGFKCCQCEHKYHFVCLKELGVDRILSDPWFCSSNCEEVHSGLESRIGFSNLIADGFSWSVLRCIQDDQNVHSAQQLALKAECNSKLAVALTIMEECFVSMVDSRTGIDMIPQVIYNWGSEFPRLDYHGFYSVVLEKNDVLISVACIRVHGVELAEMPLVATCSKYRRKGMCRRLLTAVEQVLTSFKVEKLVVAAIPDLVETWTVGFGFVPVEEEEKKSLNKINLMVFPGTVLLKKTLNSGQPDALKLQGAGPADVHPSLGMDKSMQEGASLEDQGEHKSEKDEIYGGKDPGFMNAKLVSSHGTEILESQILSPDSDGNKCELVSFNVENESKITNPISQDGAELERKENETSSCFAIEVENKVLKPMLDEATQLADVIPSEADIKVAVEPDPQEASSPKNSSHPCSSAALEAQHESASKATLQLV